MNKEILLQEKIVIVSIKIHLMRGSIDKVDLLARFI